MRLLDATKERNCSDHAVRPTVAKTGHLFF